MKDKLVYLVGLMAIAFIVIGLYPPMSSDKPSFASNTITATANQPILSTTITPSMPPLPSLKVQYRACDTDAHDSQILPCFTIINTGHISVTLDSIRLQYFFTVGTPRQFIFACQYAAVTCNHVWSDFRELRYLADRADYILTIGFKRTAPQLLPGQHTELIIRANRFDWATLNETDDYSYDRSSTILRDWSRVVLWYKDTRIWGIPPAQLVPDPQIKLQYMAKSADPSARIKPYFKLINVGERYVKLSELKVRYWYTADSNSGQQGECIYTMFSCNHVVTLFTKLATARPGADYYADVTFTNETTGLAQRESSGAIMVNIHNSNWSTYQQSGDYSYDASYTTYADYSRMTVYWNGKLIWGTEPPLNALTKTPIAPLVPTNTPQPPK